MKERPILFSAPMVRALLAGMKTQTRRIVKPGRTQDWLSEDTLNAVKRWAPSKDNWWTMAVGEESRIVHCGHEMDGGHIGSVTCPYGAPGARLWVRETWRTEEREDGFAGVRFRADDAFAVIENTEDAADLWLSEHHKPSAKGGKWRPSIFIPRWASRINLDVTGVRVERLQAISDADAIAEGIEQAWGHDVPAAMGGNAKMWRDYGPTNAPFSSPYNSYRSLWESINGPGSWAENPWVWVVEFKRVTP